MLTRDKLGAETSFISKCYICGQVRCCHLSVITLHCKVSLSVWLVLFPFQTTKISLCFVLKMYQKLFRKKPSDSDSL